MLIADGPAWNTAARPSDQVIRVTAAASAVLHLLLLAPLIVSWRASSMPQNVPQVEIEMVMSQAMTPGQAPRPPQTPQKPQPPQDTKGAAMPPPPPPPPSEVNIGNGPEQTEALSVTGKDVVPPSLNARFHNRPPSYPAEAARVGAEGTVQLLIHVSPFGVPTEIRVLQSSGNQSLDISARRAVQFWRFQPALEGGRPVEADLPYAIRFSIGDHQ